MGGWCDEVTDGIALVSRKNTLCELERMMCEVVCVVCY